MGFLCSQSQGSMIELPFVSTGQEICQCNLFLVIGTSNEKNRSGIIEVRTVIIWEQHALSLHLTISN